MDAPKFYMDAPKRSAFTLVELIVVIAVLAVLAAISFSTVSNVTSSARDSARLSDISNIKTSLEVYGATKGVYPAPDNVVNITWSGALAWSQGTFGDNTARQLGTISKPQDPKWGAEYTYSLANNKREYELATVLEKATSFAPLNKAYAAGESYDPTIKGNYNGVALKATNGNSIWILSVPTIIASDTKDANLSNVVLSFGKTGNLPASYVGKATSSQALAAAFSASQVWSGAALPKTDSEYSALTTALQNAYSGSFLATTNNTIKSLLATSDAKSYGANVVSQISGSTIVSNNNNNNNGGTPILTDTGGVWVKVPGNATFGTSDFYVMKYEAKVAGGAANSGYNGHNYSASETIVSNAVDIPVVYVTQGQAITACQSIGAHLITNNEYMTMARNAEQVASNWSGNAVGNGYMYSGHNDASPNYALAASATDTDGYINTGNSAGSNQRRTLTLSNGQVIWDLAGNVWEHVNKANTTNGTGYATNQTSIAGCSTPTSWSEWSTCSDKTFSASNGSYNSTQGIGQIHYSQGVANNVFLRGGGWTDGAGTGVFALYLDWDASGSGSNVGFRCAK